MARCFSLDTLALSAGPVGREETRLLVKGTVGEKRNSIRLQGEVQVMREFGGDRFLARRVT